MYDEIFSPTTTDSDLVVLCQTTGVNLVSPFREPLWQHLLFEWVLAYLVELQELFQLVLNMSIELADKGREGKPIGTIFVVGDHESVLQLSKQMIMNPFKGYDEEERNILSGSLKETIREFAAMDGAFVIADDGTVLAAGRYLGAAIDENTLPRGLGSRHIAAAGITALTKALSFVISESSGDVRIFKDGQIIMHIEKAPAKK